MQNKFNSTNWAVALCAASLAFASVAQASPLANFRVIDGVSRVSPPATGNNIQPIQRPGLTTSTASPQASSSGGADDPANHDAGDDRGRGRHRHRGNN